MPSKQGARRRGDREHRRRRVPALLRSGAVLSHREEALPHREEALPRRVPMPSYVGGGLSHHDEACAPRGREASCPKKTPLRGETGRPDAERGPSRRQEGPSRARTMPPPRGRMPRHGERVPSPRGHAWSGRQSLVSERLFGTVCPDRMAVGWAQGPHHSLTRPRRSVALRPRMTKRTASAASDERRCPRHRRA
jgi:hypothetical protein